MSAIRSEKRKNHNNDVTLKEKLIHSVCVCVYVRAYVCVCKKLINSYLHRFKIAFNYTLIKSNLLLNQNNANLYYYGE